MLIADQSSTTTVALSVSKKHVIAVFKTEESSTVGTYVIVLKVLFHLCLFPYGLGSIDKGGYNCPNDSGDSDAVENETCGIQNYLGVGVFGTYKGNDDSSHRE